MFSQKGFAALEIILLMAIISTLAAVVVPKMVRMVDVATLNYEVKKFQSEFFFARSLSRSISFEPGIFLSSVRKSVGINFFVNKDSYRIEHESKILREYHFMQEKFVLSYPSKLNEVIFTSNGKPKGDTGTYTFTSPLKNKRYLKLDSVGRLRLDDEN